MDETRRFDGFGGVWDQGSRVINHRAVHRKKGGHHGAGNQIQQQQIHRDLNQEARNRGREITRRLTEHSTDPYARSSWRLARGGNITGSQQHADLVHNQQPYQAPTALAARPGSPRSLFNFSSMAARGSVGNHDQNNHSHSTGGGLALGSSSFVPRPPSKAAIRAANAMVAAAANGMVGGSASGSGSGTSTPAAVPPAAGAGGARLNVKSADGQYRLEDMLDNFAAARPPSLFTSFKSAATAGSVYHGGNKATSATSGSAGGGCNTSAGEQQHEHQDRATSGGGMAGNATPSAPGAQGTTSADAEKRSFNHPQPHSQQGTASIAPAHPQTQLISTTTGKSVMQSGSGVLRLSRSVAGAAAGGEKSGGAHSFGFRTRPFGRSRIHIGMDASRPTAPGSDGNHGNGIDPRLSAADPRLSAVAGPGGMQMITRPPRPPASGSQSQSEAESGAGSAAASAVGSRRPSRQTSDKEDVVGGLPPRPSVPLQLHHLFEHCQQGDVAIAGSGGAVGSPDEPSAAERILAALDTKADKEHMEQLLLQAQQQQQQQQAVEREHGEQVAQAQQAHQDEGAAGDAAAGTATTRGEAKDEVTATHSSFIQAPCISAPIPKANERRRAPCNRPVDSDETFELQSSTSGVRILKDTGSASSASSAALAGGVTVTAAGALSNNNKPGGSKAAGAFKRAKALLALKERERQKMDDAVRTILKSVHPEVWYGQFRKFPAPIKISSSAAAGAGGGLSVVGGSGLSAAVVNQAANNTHAGAPGGGGGLGSGAGTAAAGAAVASVLGTGPSVAEQMRATSSAAKNYGAADGADRGKGQHDSSKSAAAEAEVAPEQVDEVEMDPARRRSTSRVVPTDLLEQRVPAPQPPSPISVQVGSLLIRRHDIALDEDTPTDEVELSDLGKSGAARSRANSASPGKTSVARTVIAPASSSLSAPALAAAAAPVPPPPGVAAEQAQNTDPPIASTTSAQEPPPVPHQQPPDECRKFKLNPLFVAEYLKHSFPPPRLEKGWEKRGVHLEECRAVQLGDQSNKLAWRQLSTANEFAAALAQDSEGGGAMGGIGATWIGGCMGGSKMNAMLNGASLYSSPYF